MPPERFIAAAPPVLAQGPALLFFLFIVLVLAAIVYGYYAAMKRQDALSKVALELGFEFHPARDQTKIGGRFDRINLLQEGHDRYTENHLVGRIENYSVVACDYHYAVGSGKNRSDHYYGVVFVEIPMQMPEVRIRQEHIFDKIAAAVGFEDIDFELAEFSKRYYVAAADRKFAYDLIHARAIEYLLEHPDYCWEFEGSTIAMYQSGRFKPEQIRPAIETAVGFIRLVPEFVWQERGMSTREDRHVT